MRHSGVSAVSESQLMMVIFVIAATCFATYSFLYIRHIKRMKRIRELLDATFRETPPKATTGYVVTTATSAVSDAENDR